MAIPGLQELIDNFALFDSWQDRYAYLIDLGGKLESMPDHLKTPENKVSGCMSQVWMTAEIRDGIFHFQADSDGQIVRGLIYILVSAFQDKPVQEIRSIGIEDVFRKIGLDQNLAANRRNGFVSMVNKIRELAGIK